MLTRWDDASSFSRLGTYGKSKLLAVMFCEMLAARVKPDVVLVNASNPGLTKGTILGQNNVSAGVWLAAKVAMALLARSTATGASTLGGCARGRGRRETWELSERLDREAVSYAYLSTSL